MNLKMPWASAFVSILATFTPANAQTPTEPPDPNSETNAADEQKAPVEIIPLRQWRYEALYADGWSIARFIDDVTVYGATGEQIGDLENVLVGKDGKILAVVIEMGGFLDFGDTHIMVPWDQVEVDPSLNRIDVPVNQENAEKYSMYGVSSFVTKAESQDKQVVFEEIATGPRVWQVTELLYDFALLNERAGYGYVDDLIFSREGKLVAVVVNPDYGNTPGRYAYPYYGFDYGFDPGAPFYSLGYGKDEAAELKPFDDKKLRN